MSTASERKVKLLFYKASGKFYTTSEATVKHWLYEDGYKQDIVNTQTALVNGWQNGSLYVQVTEHPSYAGKDINTFDEHLFMIGAFKGLVKETDI